MPYKYATREEARAANLESKNRYREKNRDKLRAAGREYGQKYRVLHPKIYSETDREYNRQYRARNAARLKTLAKKSNDTEPAIAAREAYRNWGRHGLSKQEWLDILAKGCGICGSTENLVIDHCHVTSKLRGALCAKHNSALGGFGDDPHLLRAAIRWVGGETGWQPSV